MSLYFSDNYCTHIGLCKASAFSRYSRELSHRARGVGVSNFTAQEVDFLDSRGNRVEKARWLALYDPSVHIRVIHDDVRR